ncbi:PKD domain-containing protein [Flavobacterium sp. JLP]|uniref:PKD domain-containing protein n=1 Tax=unclassified Flavobacterium TaxID=196869 RepID=UPI00188CF899|nr:MULTISPECIES: PKD domain-containing protein [unclassified Flavobacterium]MBF4492577.1 PKD domain-containing protein [Flavobacterium sp. MR2016-29]MBF4506145.1 PKD domain-containing protein [Flavobacterium sp. JLP]
MKIKAINLFVITVLVLSFSCSKSDIERGIDCVAESTFIKLKHTADATNTKIINYEIEYTGTYALTSVKWTFGDGTTQTVSGKTVSHTYATGGTFAVKADVTIKKDKQTCTSSPTKSVTVN